MRKFLVFLPILAVLLMGCTKGGSPQFLSPEEPVGVDPNAQPAVNERLAREAGVIHLIYHVGPVDLPAGTGLDIAQEESLTMKFQADQPLWIIGFEPKVIDASGETLPSELLHQAIISNMHEENSLCAEASTGNPFIVATSSASKIKLPEGYGYPVLPTDPLEAKVVLFNPTEENYVDVSFELNVTAKPMNEFAGMKDVKPMLLDLDPCTHKPLQVEPEKFVKRQATFQMSNAGKIMIAQAVLQDYGAYVELIKQNDVMPFWKAEAILDESHRILELTNNPLEDPSGVKLKKGDPITLGVAYDNTATSWLKGANGAAMIYFAPE